MLMYWPGCEAQNHRPDYMFTKLLGIVMPVIVFVDMILSKIARDEFLDEA